MKPRAVLLSIVLSAAGACQLSGGMVSLGSGNANSLATAGTTDTGGSGGSADGVAGNGAAGSLNVGDADTLPMPCPDGKKTTVSGIVWDPAGNVPLYNAVVYVPAPGQAPSFQDKVACETCGEKVSAVAVTLSGPDGSFLLDQDVPDTNQIDLVVQLGKWFRQVRVPITPCATNPLTDKKYTRLPKFKGDGDVSHIPKIALSTGHSDALECLLRKIGIDDSEFTTDAHDGRVSMFVGCEGDQTDKHTGAAMFTAKLGGESFPSTNQLFDTPGELDKYDVVIFSCEGHKCTPTDAAIPIQTPEHIAQLVDFANRGGRVYLDHDHYNWLNHAGDTTDAGPGDKIESAAQFSASSTTPPSPLSAQINTDPGFYKGQDFAQWLVNVNASTTLGTLQIYSGKTSATDLSPNRAQSWIFRDKTQTFPDYFYFTIGTPVAIKDDDPPPTACGRVVFTDLHVSKSGGGTSDDMSDQTVPFPTGCNENLLSGQEKALEFMIFDLTSCVQKETDKPTPPVVK